MSAAFASFRAWIIPASVVALIVFFLILRPSKKKQERAVGPELPTSLTPVSLLAFLENLLENPSLSDEKHDQLTQTVDLLKDRAFGPSQDVPDADELQEMARSSLQLFPPS